MKTAVSIPDAVFEQAEMLARRRNISRSELYATALKALLAEDAAVTAKLDTVYGSGDRVDLPDPAVTVAARRTFAASDW